MEKNRLALIAGFIAALLAACADANVRTDTFATMKEARERGAVERGWVPPALPEGAYELRTAYDPEGWRRWGIINFHPEDADAVRALLAPGEMSLQGVRMDIPARIEWWPVALRSELDAEEIAATGLRAYRATSGNLVFAVNWNQGRAYYWAVAE